MFVLKSSLLVCFSFMESQDVLCEQTFDQARRESRRPKHSQIVLIPSHYLFKLTYYTCSSFVSLTNLVRKGRGTYRYSLWCCRPCWDAWLVPTLDLSSRMPAECQQLSESEQNGAEFAGFGWIWCRNWDQGAVQTMVPWWQLAYRITRGRKMTSQSDRKWATCGNRCDPENI